MDVLITGSTGMVGKSVLNECIKDDRIGKIYLVNRVPVNLKSSKIYEFISLIITYIPIFRFYRKIFFLQFLV